MVSGPSGVGKTTLAAAVLRASPDLVLSVSATTRPPRPGETDGREYRFMDAGAFEALAAAGGFLETAEVHGHRYGTPRAPVEEARAAGRTVILEIDVQGAKAVKAIVPEAVTVFVLPPSDQALRDRLTGRGTEDPQALATRLANAEAELAEAHGFDHQVVNDELDAAVEALIRILEGADTPGQEDP